MKIIFLSVVCATLIYAASASTSEEIMRFQGQDLELRCSGRGINWSKDEKPFPANQLNLAVTVGETTTTRQPYSLLTIKTLSLSDAASYKCFSHQSKDVEKKFNVKVYDPLTIEGITRNRDHIREKQDVTLKCNVKGVPYPSVKWYHGKNLLKNGTEVITSEELTLKDVTPNQAGEYTCVAYQVYGSIKYTQERIIKLDIEYAPAPQKTNTTVIYTDPGQTETLSCLFMANPFVHFKWSQDGKEIHNDIDSFNDVSRLKVKLDEAGMKRTYICTAKNDYGSASHVFSFDYSANKPEINSSSFIASSSLFTLAFITMIINVFY